MVKKINYIINKYIGYGKKAFTVHMTGAGNNKKSS